MGIGLRCYLGVSHKRYYHYLYLLMCEWLILTLSASRDSRKQTKKNPNHFKARQCVGSGQTFFLGNGISVHVPTLFWGPRSLHWWVDGSTSIIMFEHIETFQKSFPGISLSARLLYALASVASQCVIHAAQLTLGTSTSRVGFVCGGRFTSTVTVAVKFNKTLLSHFVLDTSLY